MDGQPPSLPHFLFKAHDDLLKSLNRPSFRRSEIEACIGQFVFSLSKIPSGMDELKRRATLVETLCAPESKYAEARRAAGRSFDEPTVGYPGAMEALDFIRSIDWTPRDKSVLETISGRIGQVIQGYLEDKPAARDAYRRWDDVCKAIWHEAEHCQADGCRDLLLVHEAGGADPSGHAVLIRGLMFSDSGAVSRRALIPAAESLLDWVRNARHIPATSADQDNDESIIIQGFLGGEELANALGIHATRRDAFFQWLLRQRMSLGDDCWHEVKDPPPNSPRFLYRVDSQKLRELATGYKTPKPT